MKSLLYSLVAVLLLAGCYKKEHDEHVDHDHDARAKDVVKNSDNLELYNEVMKIHDDVMPEMETIYNLKKKLKKKITDDPNMNAAERIKVDAMISKLDSASEIMMVWMREFRPLPDSVGEEKAKAYLEQELERVKVVRDRMQAALKEAGAIE